MTKINKEGWEIKKLGEVATIKPSKKEWLAGISEEDFVSFIPMEELPIEHKYTQRSQSKQVAEATKSSYTLFADNDVLLAKVTPCFENGKIAIAKELINGLGFGSSEFYVFRANQELLPDWLYYNLKSQRFILAAKENLNGASGLKRISKSYVENYTIPLPPLPIQQRIVEELDEINAIISAKKQQISKLDELAQSIFYNMFGDPVANEKRWKTYAWEEVLKIINGKNQKAVESPNGQYPICGSGGVMGYATDYLCPEHTTIIGRKGNINKPIYMKEKFWNVDTAFGLVADNVLLSPLYLFFFCIEFDFERLNKAVTIPSLTKADLLKIKIPLPPLPLQEAFAARVSAIEEQKSSISASIEKMQTLLDARMQEYFG